jgi:tetratricopeptide (TPR) repeat protein
MKVFNKLLDGSAAMRAQSKRSTAILFMYQGKYSEAIAPMHDAVVLHNSIDYRLSELRNRLYLCKIYQAKGMEEEFQSELDHCTSFVGEAATEPTWFLRVGMMLVRKGDVEKAEKMLEEISERSNKGNRIDEAAYKLLKGEITLAQGNSSAALVLLESAGTLNEDAYHQESLARYHMMMGNWEKAIVICEKIIADRSTLGWEAQESWIQAHYYLHKAYEVTGDLEKANSIGGKILEIWKEADEDLPQLLELKSSLNPVTSSS